MIETTIALPAEGSDANETAGDVLPPIEPSAPLTQAIERYRATFVIEPTRNSPCTPNRIGPPVIEYQART